MSDQTPFGDSDQPPVSGGPTPPPAPGEPAAPPVAPPADQPPAPGYWKASDGNWYPPQAQPGPAAAGPMTGQLPPANGMATAAMVLGIVGICTFWFLGLGGLLGILAIIFGVLGMNKAKELPGRFLYSRAKVGLITGIVALAANILFVVIWAMVIVDTVNNIEINSDPSDGTCNRDRFLQDPDC